MHRRNLFPQPEGPIWFFLMPWAVSLWHKRAGVATRQSRTFSGPVCYVSSVCYNISPRLWKIFWEIIWKEINENISRNIWCPGWGTTNLYNLLPFSPSSCLLTRCHLSQSGKGSFNSPRGRSQSRIDIRPRYSPSFLYSFSAYANKWTLP